MMGFSVTLEGRGKITVYLLVILVQYFGGYDRTILEQCFKSRR
jgi:hypothetical protein